MHKLNQMKLQPILISGQTYAVLPGNGSGLHTVGSYTVPGAGAARGRGSYCKYRMYLQFRLQTNSHRPNSNMTESWLTKYSIFSEC